MTTLSRKFDELPKLCLIYLNRVTIISSLCSKSRTCLKRFNNFLHNFGLFFKNNKENCDFFTNFMQRKLFVIYTKFLKIINTTN